MSSLDKKMDHWIKNDFNVLLRGRAGVGKTALVKEAFERAGLKSLYFSASTLDVFTDFCGAPKEAKDDKGNSYLEFIRPKYMQDEGLQAIFLDEFNRAGKKLRNAVLELIQHKSINGNKFPNLKIVWAAINPDDDEEQTYDVDVLDPAQKDRFHVIYDIPYACSSEYFKNTYGNDMADAALTWWKELPNDIKKDISPRRLDYALMMYKKGGDVRDVLTPKANINKLMVELETGSISKKLNKLFDEQITEEAKKFLTIENNYSACIEHIVKKQNYINFFVPLLSDEKITSLITKHRLVEDYVITNAIKFEVLLKDIAKANTNYKLTKRIESIFKPKKIDIKNIFLITPEHIKDLTIKQHSTMTPSIGYHTILFKTGADLSIKQGHYHTQSSQTRIKAYNAFNSFIPQTMTETECTKTLGHLSSILIHSHDTTVKAKMYNLIPMINHTILVLASYAITPSFDKRTLNCLKLYPDFIYNVISQNEIIKNPLVSTAPTYGIPLNWRKSKGYI